jgi:hypothetical protein
LVVTYLAVVGCEGLVRSRWPDALPISVKVADAVGLPPTHAAAEPPTVRYIDVLHHALRHLRFLTDPSSIGFDAPIAGELDETWQRHLTTFEPAIARMYGREHRPLSPRTGAGPNG